ncbi:uncharacterized protein LOC130934337 [Arachis stenosperma]|uniref:uncharacterized protein LOC130934337 n=1 Tax=Arachis stenosperma TaxID=217475 RepID=UPI0025AC66F6|nr:uncharacterized protein LOC130934337 [Arachis stenosperma]
MEETGHSSKDKKTGHKLSKNTHNFMQETRASLGNLKIHVGQSSKQASEKPPNTLSSDTIPNPREECKAIHLRSGKVTGSKEKVSEEPVEKEAPEKKNEEVEHAPSRHLDNPFLVDLEKYLALPKAPQKLQINIPFVEALEQMPLYAKFMKELERKDITIQRALCDLGASINLMSLSLMRKLQIDEVKPTRISLQLADHSIKFSLGVVENLLVKVEPFIFPTDFIILDMEEDKNASIILGRPFLATGRALIDVQKDELILKVNKEEVVLNVLEALQHPNDSEGYMRVDLIEPLIKYVFEAKVLDDILDSSSEDDLLEIDDSPPQKEKPQMPSTEEGPSKLELKPLPSSLKYAFLGEHDTYLVIISSSLRHEEEYALLQVLKSHKWLLGGPLVI